MRSVAMYGVPRVPLLRINLARPFPDSVIHVDPQFFKKRPASFFSPCYTSVRLENIRRIALSCGSPGKTRATTHISGLRFDFYRSNTPVHIGQWFEEVANTCFEPGGIISSLTFWQTQEICSARGTVQRENTGKLAGIRIAWTTSSGPRHFEFRPAHDEALLSFSYTENPFEEMVGTHTISADICRAALTVSSSGWSGALLTSTTTSRRRSDLGIPLNSPGGL